ncbi:MAG: GxxExxY protein [Patescibacteria group bacterium]|nr:GxxExxY protein [Patescibacteria group bacterium]MBU2509133.1 GxxExxY protein [Patescibacteria group bacterium]
MGSEISHANHDYSKKPETILVYPKLSYMIVGALFDVYNELGGGLLEKAYQRAIAKALTDKKISFEEQVPFEIKFRGERIGKQYFDFLIEDSVVLEIKQGDRFRKSNLDQVIAYLRTADKMLPILANFGRDGVLFRRLVNLRD